MSLYQFGQTKAAKEAREAEIRARQKVAELRRLEAELEARIEARKQQLKHVPKVRTYAPTAEQVRAWEAHKEAEAKKLPEPVWGGPHNLYLASLEASGWDQTHRRGKRKQNAA
ncbi:hypothetical protein ACFC25_04235 [Pseudarthrobacter sp. NPDC055928]|uniref:hypothetical protein n=1 Tax=Pseudarthrobacter sp. NPDC055928 TaxID=3345661 RepID=UPI0035E0156C